MTTYHHGDLRRSVLDRALVVVAEEGANRLSLRSIAADLQVSHTAPRHHFGSNAGLLTAIAVEGFVMLGESLRRLRENDAPFLDLGVAYVRFAVEHPAHFAVMFQPQLLHLEDPEYVAASSGAFGELRMGVDALSANIPSADAAAAVTAAWALMHGLATLELTGNLERSQIRGLLGVTDIGLIAQRTGSMLFGASGGTT